MKTYKGLVFAVLPLVALGYFQRNANSKSDADKSNAELLREAAELGDKFNGLGEVKFIEALKRQEEANPVASKKRRELIYKAATSEDQKERERIYKDILRENPNDNSVKISLAVTLKKLQKPEEARFVLEQVVSSQNGVWDVGSKKMLAKL